MVVLTPIARARQAIAVSAKAGLRLRERAAYRRSAARSSSHCNSHADRVSSRMRAAGPSSRFACASARSLATPPRSSSSARVSM
jgi:hypothetical protein